MRPPKALLIFPPQWSPQNPHFALRALSGHLRSTGIEVVVRDLNIEYYDRVLTRAHLEEVTLRMRVIDRYVGTQIALARALGDIPPDLAANLQAHRAWMLWHEGNPGALQYVTEHVEDAKRIMRDPERFYEPALAVRAMTVLDQALEIAVLPFHPARLALNSFESPGSALTVEGLIGQVENARANPFAEFFCDQIPSLLAQEADYIGLSINSFSQVLPGLALARALKKAEPRGHVSIGGNFFARVKDILAQRPRFFEEFCDSVACGEGEKTVEVLVRALAGREALEAVPNLLLWQGGQVLVTPEARPPTMDEIGPQDLAGLPLDRYLTPELVLTLQSSKSCYWARCTFCDSYVGVNPDSKSLDLLVAEIRHLSEQYGVRHFQFIDEAISPARLRAMARRFLAEGLEIRWFCNGRLENRFTAELLELLFEAGCRMILWGFESGSPRIFGLIRKGVAFERRLSLLRDSAQAGLWNFAYVFFGFPSETWDEAMLTVEAICANTDAIHSYGRSVFTLGKHAPLFADRAKLGLVDVVEDREELSSNLSYQDSRGMTDQELSEAMRLCSRRCWEAYDHGMWFYLRYRENIHLYLCRYGRDWLANQRLIQDTIPAGQFF